MYSAGGQIKIQVHYSIGKLYLVNSDVLWLFPRFKNSTIYLETRLQIEISVFPLMSGNFLVKLKKAWAINFTTKNFLFHAEPFCENGILLPKLFWPTVRKNCSSDQEKLLKFEAEGWELAKKLRPLDQFIPTAKGQKKIWNKKLL